MFVALGDLHPNLWAGVTMRANRGPCLPGAFGAPWLPARRRSCPQTEAGRRPWRPGLDAAVVTLIVLAACTRQPPVVSDADVALVEVETDLVATDIAPSDAGSAVEARLTGDLSAASADGDSKDDAQLPPSDVSAVATAPGPNGELCALGKVWQAGQCVPAIMPFEMVEMPAITYEQGCDPATNVCAQWEMPVHSVKLSAFLIGKFEVTAGQYKKCVDLGKCSPITFTVTAPGEGCSEYKAPCTYGVPGLEDHPIKCVVKSEALQYCKAMVPGGTLPTEAQWERAARTDCSGSSAKLISTRFVWGDQWPPPSGAGNLCDESCYHKYWGYIEHYQDGAACTAPVGSYPHDGNCLKDVAGNVLEVVLDDWDPEFFAKLPPGAIDPVATGIPAFIGRGSAYSASAPETSQLSHRAVVPIAGPVDFVALNGGFRCVSNFPAK